MKVGLGIPGPVMNRETFRFARQIGATHLVAHFASDRGARLDVEGFAGLERSVEYDRRFTYEHFVQTRELATQEGLEVAAVENFTAADWSDVLLDGPRRDQQIHHLGEIIADLGRAGIPILGYNFSLAGVWGRRLEPVARGGALSAVFRSPEEPPIPRGMIWNQIYDEALYQASDGRDYVTGITSEQLWDRHRRFLEELLPVAEAAGVTLALHPDDPPTAWLRGTPRLVYRGELYDRVLGVSASPANGLEFCVGTL
ncbi:MAG: mannonate dehydratase, partial [Bifidobacteriaceae bacterium]|nr:mannonate dehydratase [Bifidobacteriaceae bacterium]